jgi:hypothetical protein
MPDRIDTGMQIMELSGTPTPEDRVGIEAQLSQLRDRDHPVLAPSELGHDPPYRGWAISIVNSAIHMAHPERVAGKV